LLPNGRKPASRDDVGVGRRGLDDAMQLVRANGKRVAVRVVDGQVKVHNANVLASVRASNGMVHIIDAVLLPPLEK